MRGIASLLCSLLFVTACTVTHVERVGIPSHRIPLVCIEENADVQVDDFLQVVQNSLRRHGIRSWVFAASPPQKCDYFLNYTARRSWDLLPFLSYAKLTLRHGSRVVGSALYRGTRHKIAPLIDELLAP